MPTPLACPTCEPGRTVVDSESPQRERAARSPLPMGLARSSDERLVILAGRGDEAAFAELYERFGRLAYALALRILRDQTLAEDAVQEAFVAVWRSAARFEVGRAKASTWILMFVHRRSVDLVRRQEHRHTEPLEAAPQAIGGSAEEAVWRRLERQRIQRALGRLPRHERETIELAYYGGFTQAEVAEQLGIPLGTVKSRMFAALRRLGHLLELPRLHEKAL